FFEPPECLASVSIEGAKTREIQVVVDEEKLTQYRVSPQEVIQVLTETTQSSSVDTISKADQDLIVRITGEFTSVTDIEQTVIQTQSGASINVADVASIEDTFKKDDSITLVNGEPSVVMSILKKTDANTVDVAQNIKNGFSEIEGE